MLKTGRGVSAARAHEESGKSKQAAEERNRIKDVEEPTSAPSHFPALHPISGRLMLAFRFARHERA